MPFYVEDLSILGFYLWGILKPVQSKFQEMSVNPFLSLESHSSKVLNLGVSWKPSDL